MNTQPKVRDLNLLSSFCLLYLSFVCFYYSLISAFRCAHGTEAATGGALLKKLLLKIHYRLIFANVILSSRLRL